LRFRFWFHHVMMMMMVVVMMVVDDHLLGWHLLLFLRKGRDGEAKRNEGRPGLSARSPLPVHHCMPRRSAESATHVGFHNGQLCAWPFTNKNSRPPSDF
jgi:hypothetical protein